MKAGGARDGLRCAMADILSWLLGTECLAQTSELIVSRCSAPGSGVILESQKL